MSKVKRFRDEDDYIEETNPDFKKLVRDAEKKRQADRKNKRREKRSYLDEDDNNE